MTAPDLLSGVTIEPERAADTTVIWLHGLGADGHDFEPIVPALNLPAQAAVRFIFPHAPFRPVTINNGMRMRAWYDISGSEMSRREDEAGIRGSEAALRHIIEHEITRAIPSERIVLVGFSQGGAMALHCGLRYPAALAGIAALSTYLPLADHLASEAHPANHATSILMAHGTDDAIIPLLAGRRSLERLRTQGYVVDWRSYSMGHSVCPEEVTAISDWLCAILGLGA